MVQASHDIDPAWLGSAAGWLAQVAPLWEDLTGEVQRGRQYRLIASSLHLEAWLICWPSGGRLELHDHGGACGAVQVIGGALSEQFVADRSLPTRRRHLQAGHGISFDADYAHDVVNLGDPTATSVHVYSSATRAMAYYRLTNAGMLRRAEGIDDAVVVDAAPGGLSLTTVP